MYALVLVGFPVEQSEPYILEVKCVSSNQGRLDDLCQELNDTISEHLHQDEDEEMISYKDFEVYGEPEWVVMSVEEILKIKTGSEISFLPVYYKSIRWLIE